MADDKVSRINVLMKVILEGTKYTVLTEDSRLAEDVENMFPLSLDMRRNGKVEFVAELPKRPVNDGRHVSHIRPNEVYYFEGWNVLCLNYAEDDISPYYVSYIGRIEDPEFSETLLKAEDHMKIKAER